MEVYTYGAKFVFEGLRRRTHMWAESEAVLGLGPSQNDIREVVCLHCVLDGVMRKEFCLKQPRSKRTQDTSTSP